MMYAVYRASWIKSSTMGPVYANATYSKWQMASGHQPIHVQTYMKPENLYDLYTYTYTHDFQFTIIHIWIHDTWPYGLHYKILINQPWWLNNDDRDVDDCCWFPSSPTRTKRVPAIIKTYRVSHTDDLVSIQERSLPKRSFDYYKSTQTWYSIYNGTHVIYVTQ